MEVQQEMSHQTEPSAPPDGVAASATMPPRRRFYRLSPEQHDRLWRAYLVHKTVSAASRMAGVARKTARRYIERGDPARGLRPLRQRLQEVEEAVAIRRTAGAADAAGRVADTLYADIVDPATGQLRDRRMATMRGFKVACDAELALLRVQAKLENEG